jgi:hypothetical protein
MHYTSTVFVSTILILGSIAQSGATEKASLQVPQSFQIQHQQIIKQLIRVTKHKGKVGAAASKAVIFLKNHYEKEEAFILPLLGLLPRLAKDEISNDMEPAIAMAEHARTASSEFEDSHIQITAMMNELIEAGRNNHDEHLIDLATRIASQSLNDIEVAQPIAIIIGDLIRQKLSKQ